MPQDETEQPQAHDHHDAEQYGQPEQVDRLNHRKDVLRPADGLSDPSVVAPFEKRKKIVHRQTLSHFGLEIVRHGPSANNNTDP